MSVQKMQGKMSRQLWLILLNFHNLYFETILALHVIIQVHNACTPDGNLGMYAGAEDIWNAFLTAYLEFKNHFKEHSHFFFPYNETHLSIKVFSVKINKVGLEEHISQRMQSSGSFSFHSCECIHIKSWNHLWFRKKSQIKRLK